MLLVPKGQRPSGKAHLRVAPSIRSVVEILCRAVTLQAMSLRGLVVLTWALWTLSHGGDCCNLEMAYTWLSTSQACPLSCAVLHSSTI